MPNVTGRSTAFATPWFTVVAKTVDGAKDPHYVLEMADYVTVLATTADGSLVLVRQWRPVTESATLELPSGTVDPGETPEAAARRELLEETGYVAGALEPLGRLVPDTGREGNRLWGFYAPGVAPAVPARAPEPGLEAVRCTRAEFAEHLKEGRFDHALNLAVLFQAIQRGAWSLP